MAVYEVALLLPVHMRLIYPRQRLRRFLTLFAAELLPLLFGALAFFTFDGLAFLAVDLAEPRFERVERTVVFFLSDDFSSVADSSPFSAASAASRDF